jgi:hypothetical protein
MKRLVAAALVAAQIAGAPAAAADLPDAGRAAGPTRLGGFAGARLHIAFGGPERGGARMGLAIAPVRRTATGSGEIRLRFGEGLEFGLAGRERPALRVAGYRLAGNGDPRGPQGRRLGVSTLGAATIAATVILVGALAVALTIRSDDD